MQKLFYILYLFPWIVAAQPFGPPHSPSVSTSQPSTSQPSSQPASMDLALDVSGLQELRPKTLPPITFSPKKAFARAVLTTAGAWGAGMAVFVGSAFVCDGCVYGGLLLFAAGTAIAPSAGHIYAQEVRHARIFSALRFASHVSYVWGVFGLGINDEGTALFGGALDVAAIAGGLTSLAALSLYDFYDAPRAAKRANHRLTQPMGSQ